MRRGERFGARSLLALLVLAACGDDDAETETSADPPVEEVTPPATGAAVAAPPRVEPLATAGFDVVPRRALRGRPLDFAFPRSHPRSAIASDARGNVLVFDVPSGHLRAVRRAFFRDAFHVAVAADAPRVVVDSGDENSGFAYDVGVWDLERDFFWPVPVAPVDEVTFAIEADGSHVAVLERDLSADSGALLVGNIDTREVTRRELRESVDRVYFSGDGESVFVLGDGKVRRFATATLRPGRTYELPGAVTGVHGDDFLVEVEGGAQVVPMRSGRARATLEGAGSYRWLDDGRVVGCDRGALRLFAGEAFDEVTEIEERIPRCGRLRYRMDRLESFVAGSYTVVGDEPWTFEDEDIGSFGIPPRGRYFVLPTYDAIQIASPARRRIRPLVRRGSGERSAWNARREGPRLVLEGRGWSHVFGPPSEPPPELPDVDGYLVSESPDGRHRVEQRGEELVLVSAGADEAVSLGAFGDVENGLCFESYDEDGYFCEVEVTWARDAFVVLTEEDSMAYAFGMDGQRRGRAPASRVWLDESGDRAIVVGRDGQVLLSDRALQRKGVVFRPRNVRVFEPAFRGERVVVVRGASMAIYDVTSGNRKHVVTLPGHLLEAPRLVGDGEVLVRLRSGFVWYGLESGEELRRERIDGVLAVDDARENVLLCDEGTLRLRPLRASDGGRAYGACPGGRLFAFDDELLWWVEGTRGHFVRRSDGQRLTVGVLELRRPLAFAFTPRGHLQLSHTHAMRMFRLRLPGAILDAEVVEANEENLDADLVARFLAGEPLGAPPSHAAPGDRREPLRTAGD